MALAAALLGAGHHVAEERASIHLASVIKVYYLGETIL